MPSTPNREASIICKEQNLMKSGKVYSPPFGYLKYCWLGINCDKLYKGKQVNNKEQHIDVTIVVTICFRVGTVTTE